MVRDFENGIALVKICNPITNLCFDSWDEISNTVREYQRNNSPQQIWRMSQYPPIVPDVEYIKKYWSPIKQIQRQQLDDFNNKQLYPYVYVFYNSRWVNPENIPCYLTHIPLVTVNGNEYVQLPNKKQIGPLTELNTQKYNLLTPVERRIARRMAIVSLSKIFAYGGYGGYLSQIKLYPKPKMAIIISIAAPQFEFKKLEYKNFICEPGESSQGI